MTTMKITTPKDPLARTAWIVSGLIILAMLVLSAWAWVRTPAGAQIPIHWNAAGEVDGYGSKWVGLFLMPLITTAVALLLSQLPAIDPKGANILRSGKAYYVTWIALIGLQLLVHGVIIAAILGHEANIGRIIPFGVGVMFIILGNYFGKIRPNYTMGIRTPWTLASDLSWNKTHRLGGKLFIAVGLFMATAVFLPISELWVYVMLAGLFGSIILLTIYSYIVWKQDPDKVSKRP